MITAVTGNPGSGKSFTTVKLITDALDAGKLVASNAHLKPNWERIIARRPLLRRIVPGRVARLAERNSENYYPLETIDDLLRIVLEGGDVREVGVAVLDEAHEWLNNRAWRERMERAAAKYANKHGVTIGEAKNYLAAEGGDDVTNWFAIHRHLGWEQVYLVTQHFDSIDKQVRDRVEFQMNLRNLKNAKIAGVPLVPVNFFQATTVWLGGPKTKMHVASRRYYGLDDRKRLYDTHGRRHKHLRDLGDDAIVLPRRRQAPAAAAPGSPGAAAEATPTESPANGDHSAAGGARAA